MRIFATAVFGLLFTLSLSVYLVFDSVTTLPLDPAAFTAVLRRGDVRTALLDAVETSVRREVRDVDDPEFAENVVRQLRTEIDAVLTDEWFYGTAQQLHRGLIRFLRDGAMDDAVELRETKRRIRERLLSLGDRLTATCNEVGGGRECRAAARDVGRTLRRYRGQIDRALRQVPDRVDARWAIAMAGGNPGNLGGSDDSRRVREGFALYSRLRWIGLAGLLVLLGLIALVNKRTLPRMLFNVGLVLAVAGGLYLSGVSALQGYAHREFAREDRAAGDRDVTEQAIAREAGRKFGAALVDSMFSRTRVYSGVAAGLGFALLAGGITIHYVRRRRPGTPGPRPAAAAPPGTNAGAYFPPPPGAPPPAAGAAPCPPPPPDRSPPPGDSNVT
jgi:hypothetical protein